MKRGGTALLCLLGSLLPGSGAKAATPESTPGPYQGIVDRNVFGLRPPPPPGPPEVPQSPPPKIYLTGITTILGTTNALFTVQVPNGPPQTYMLTAGQSRDEIEVLDIDAKHGTVKVKNHGIDQTLDFDNDGAKAVAAVASPARPVPVLRAPGTPPVPRVFVAPTAPPSQIRPVQPQQPTAPTARTMRLPPVPGSGNAP